MFAGLQALSVASYSAILPSYSLMFGWKQRLVNESTGGERGVGRIDHCGSGGDLFVPESYAASEEYTVGGCVLLFQVQEDGTYRWRSGAYGVLVSSMLVVDTSLLNPQLAVNHREDGTVVGAQYTLFTQRQLLESRGKKIAKNCNCRLFASGDAAFDYGTKKGGGRGRGRGKGRGRGRASGSTRGRPRGRPRGRAKGKRGTER